MKLNIRGYAGIIKEIKSQVTETVEFRTNRLVSLEVKYYDVTLICDTAEIKLRGVLPEEIEVCP